MRRTIALATLAAAAFAFAPQGAQAEHSSCGDTVVFSSPVSLNANAGRCIAQEDVAPELEEAPSTAFIHPGSTAIQVRYIPGSNLGFNVYALIDGMGINSKVVPLNWVTSTTGGGTYDSASQAVVRAETIAGCVDISVFYYDAANNNEIVELSEAHYHGYAGSC